MQKFIISLLIVLLLPVAALAGSLAWDYGDSSMLAGWIIYSQATTPGAKKDVYKLDDPSARTLDINALRLVPGTAYNIWMTAYNAHAESAKSNTVSYTTPAFVPPPDSHPVTITISAPATVTITQP